MGTHRRSRWCVGIEDGQIHVGTLPGRKKRETIVMQVTFDLRDRGYIEDHYDASDVL